MRAEQDDLAAASRAPGSRRSRWPTRVGRAPQVSVKADPDRFPLAPEPLEQVGVGRGDARRPGSSARRSRSRMPPVCGVRSSSVPMRADQEADRAVLGGGRAAPRRARPRPCRSRSRRSVRSIALVEERRSCRGRLGRSGRAPRVGSSRISRLEPALRRRDAPPERRQDELVPVGRGDFARLDPALPDLYRGFLRPDVGEALGARRVASPDRDAVPGRSGQPRARPGPSGRGPSRWRASRRGARRAGRGRRLADFRGQADAGIGGRPRRDEGAERQIENPSESTSRGGPPPKRARKRSEGRVLRRNPLARPRRARCT